MPDLCNLNRERKELCKIQYNALLEQFNNLLFKRASYMIFFACGFSVVTYLLSKTLAKISVTIAKIICTV